MPLSTSGCHATSDSTAVAWDLGSRIATVRYVPGASLVAADGVFLVDALSRFTADGGAFAVLADAAGLGGTDGAYRAETSRFFRRHRATACIALMNVGPLIHVVVEMFRLGTGIQLKTFPSEDLARSWLRTKGIAA